MTDVQIAGLLRENSEARRHAKQIRAEMTRVVVEQLGSSQKDALQMNVETFLDGYLVGRGMMPSWRICLAPEADQQAT